VCDVDGHVVPDVIMVSANQEHGVIAARPGSGAAVPDWAVGTRLRILPNHACATGAQYDDYKVLRAEGGGVSVWPRFRGW
jgi:D-serine deaminase-like pyridoxal phosphate-dependent protein